MSLERLKRGILLCASVPQHSRGIPRVAALAPSGREIRRHKLLQLQQRRAGRRAIHRCACRYRVPLASGHQLKGRRFRRAVMYKLVSVHLRQSWSQSWPPPPSPTCPSTSSSTARTSGRTCVCWASSRESRSRLRLSRKTGFCCSLTCPACCSALRFISHGITHCYSSFRGDVRGTGPSFYWMYLLSVCAGGGAWLLLWTTVNRCGRRGILLLSMTMMGLASLILLGLMKCKWASFASGTNVELEQQGCPQRPFPYSPPPRLTGDCSQQLRSCESVNLPGMMVEIDCFPGLAA